VSVAKGKVVKPTVANTTFNYTGNEQTLVIPENANYTISGTTKGTSVNTYTARVALKSTANYEWEDGTTATLEITWTIAKGKVAKPTVANTTFTYNEKEQTLVIPENANYTISGTTKGTNANTYTARVGLKSTANYEWEDGTTATLEITWTIAKANPQHTAPTGLTAKVGQTLADVSLTAHTGWSWMNPAEAVGEVGERTHKAKFTPTDAANYNVLTDIDVKVAVSAATPTPPIDTPIRDIKKSDGRFGVKFTSGNIVSDKAEFVVILPNDKAAEVRAVIYDNTGNVVFEKIERGAKVSWNLTNIAGRAVANGTYLRVAEARWAQGRYAYLAKVGVKRSEGSVWLF
jgi:hypothetical protein